MPPAVKRVFFATPIALLLAAAGYFLLPWLGFAQLSLPGLFATGLGLGCIIGALVSTPSGQARGARAGDTSKTSAPLPARKQQSANDTGERKTVFVGNLAYRASPRQLRELFEAYGTVHSVRIATDRETRKPRGFGFVEMNEKGAVQAIQTLHGSQLCNRELNLSEAKQREARY